MSRRVLTGLVVFAFVTCPGAIASAAQPRVGRPAASARTLAVHESGVRFAHGTVTLSRSFVKANLIGVSAAGVYEFKHPGGPLAALHKGSVMILQGSDAVVITSSGRRAGRVLIGSKAATLGQVISSGKITVNGPINFGQGFVAPTVTGKGFNQESDLVRPSYPYIGAAPWLQRGAHAASGLTFSVQGSAASAPFGYSLSFTPASNSHLDIAGVICFQWGSICSNGPSNGLSLEANLSGYIDAGSSSASITVNGGRITRTSFSLKAISAHLQLTYTGARGTGPDSGGDPPVFHLPVGIDYTIPGEIPIYVKLQTAVLIKLGMSSKNTVIRGGVEYNWGGSGSVAESASHATESGAGGNPSGNVLDSADGGVGPTVALGAGGVVVAVQFPKIGIGLGVRALNGIGYIDMITSVGQTAAGALSLIPGCTYDFAWSEGGGFEAQLGPFGLASARKVLIPTNGKQFEFQTKSPSC